MKLRLGLVVLAGFWTMAFPLAANGGGGGENLLMVVNPDSEAALRIANAYARLRAVPNANIVFIAPPTELGYPVFGIGVPQFISSYVNGLTTTMSARGLTNQIDYIATFGQPHTVGGGYRDAQKVSHSTNLSLTYALAMLTQLQRGLSVGDSTGYPKVGNDPGAYFRLSELFQVNVPAYTGTDLALAPTLSYTPGTNTAIHHSTHYPIGSGYAHSAPPDYDYAQWYLCANTGNAGMFALTTSQVIANLQYTVAGDGTKPAGRVYFEDSGDKLRSGTRMPFWPAVQKYMDAHGLPWVQETTRYQGSPKGRTELRGAVIGAAGAPMPNGSTYLPGSYADNLTSCGGGYASNAHTKDDKMLLTGAGGAAGTTSEPYAVQARFTLATVFIFANDGSTLGEAHFKAIPVPDFDMLEGDPLSQAYADVPRVAFTAAPADYATVKGAVTLSASAVLVPPITTTATDIDHLELFVDGLSRGTGSGVSATFKLDTTALSDGVHEIRAVACNNSAAQTQGYVLSHLTVNNQGQSIVAATGNCEIAWNQTIPVPVTVTPGSGTISGLQLQCLGRVVAAVAGSSGSLSLAASTLAFGPNAIVPVAVFADGSQVEGRAITVTRDFHRLPGGPATPSSQCTPGFKYEYFSGAAGQTIATTNFTGTPTVTLTGTILSLDPAKPLNMPDAFRYTMSNSNAGLALRVTTRLLVSTAGEYSFWFTTGGCYWDSLQFSIDGVPLAAHEFWNGTKFDPQGLPTSTADTTRSIYLAAGEHTVQVLLANHEGSRDDKHGHFDFWYRGPDGISQQPTAGNQTNGATFYMVR